jgi:serine/threonine protein kinase
VTTCGVPRLASSGGGRGRPAGLQRVYRSRAPNHALTGPTLDHGNPKTPKVAFLTMATDSTTTYGRWAILSKLGEGGSGKVYKATPASSGDLTPIYDRVYQSLRSVGSVGPSPQERQQFIRDLVDALKTLTADEGQELVALKVLDNADDKTVLARARRELDVLQRCPHPNIVRVVDADPDARWFAMELHPGGSLYDHRSRFTGRVLDALIAIRGIVEAMTLVHKQDIIHRDIKTKNIFVARDQRLVLGDFGIAIGAEEADRTRHTETDDTMGSGSWLPAWAMHQVRPEYARSIDVYMLGKVLYSMVSKERNVQPQMLARPPFDLRVQFPDREDVEHLHDHLSKIIVLDEEKCPRDCQNLLNRINYMIKLLSPLPKAEWAREQMRLDFASLGPTLHLFETRCREAYRVFSGQTGHACPPEWRQLIREARTPLPPDASKGLRFDQLVSDELAFLERNKALWAFATQMMPPKTLPLGSPAPLSLVDSFFLEFEQLMDSIADFWSRWGHQIYSYTFPHISGVVRDYKDQKEVILLLVYLLAARERAQRERRPERDGLLYLAQMWRE